MHNARLHNARRGGGLAGARRMHRISAISVNAHADCSAIGVKVLRKLVAVVAAVCKMNIARMHLNVMAVWRLFVDKIRKCVFRYLELHRVKYVMFAVWKIHVNVAVRHTIYKMLGSERGSVFGIARERHLAHESQMSRTVIVFCASLFQHAGDHDGAPV